MTHADFPPPADRIARRVQAALTLEPTRYRSEISRIFATLDPQQQAEAAALVANLPRLVHGLARQGALAAPMAPRRAA